MRFKRGSEIKVNFKTFKKKISVQIKGAVNLIIFGSKNNESAVKIIIGSRFSELIFGQ